MLNFQFLSNFPVSIVPSIIISLLLEQYLFLYILWRSKNSNNKGGVHILGGICLRSDSDIAHMGYYLDPLKFIYKTLLFPQCATGYGIWGNFNFPMLIPHRHLCKYGPHLWSYYLISETSIFKTWKSRGNLTAFKATILGPNQFYLHC